MANTATLLNRGIPGVHTAQIWQLTLDSDSSGNVSIDVSWSEMKDAPSFFNFAFAVCAAFGTTAVTNSGILVVTIDNTNKVLRVRGKNFPASTTNIPAMLVAF